MLWLRRLKNRLSRTGSDENFLKLIELTESVVSKVLSVLMIIVIFVALLDLGWFLLLELFSSPYGFFNRTLIEIFGLFLSVLIALEILENITAYLRKHVVQVELVIVTSLTAVARKIIILDLEKVSGIDIVGLAAAILALSLSYWIVRNTSPSSH